MPHRWEPRAGMDKYHELEVLIINEEELGVVENFGYCWYANAFPPKYDGTSSMVPGMIRGGAFGENYEGAKAWCERICGLHPEKPGDRGSEPKDRS